MKRLAPWLVLTLALYGCTAAPDSGANVQDDLASCEQITTQIDLMMATFEDQTASEGSVRLAFSNASSALAQTAGTSSEVLSTWATELSVLSSKLAQAVADGDGEATILSVNDLFASFEKEAEFCSAN
jgi:hypothetical protein